MATALKKEQIVKAETLAVIGEGDRVQITSRDTTGKFLVIAGKPLNEPVAHGDPYFVGYAFLLIYS